ncbi:pyridine nucleotide-disulfide oxidoreductase family protein [Stachybotrys elegans]|uniref:Pyridine nucleotide-disulfide oxidoreductase family protein n=1 Tax=Stachybotrys elegans TaxID=80388 RepID=A0A8K0SSG8_9HYPO|nr:pyridine nucleotide-disulfide oxidoreductase family protein [Stachybotrys elegans]
MSSKIVVIGTGFAGVWGALSAQRLIKQRDSQHRIQVMAVSPSPRLDIRVRFYEAHASTMTHELGRLFEAAGIVHVPGYVETVDTENQTIEVSSVDGKQTIAYDRLVLAAGSQLVQPAAISGLREHAFNIDSLGAASKLEARLKALASLPPSHGRDTVVVCGGGYTGIELAAELPGLLKHIRQPRIIIVERAEEIGPELGAGPKPEILKALRELGIEIKLGSAVTSVNEDGVCLASGQFLEARTVVWTAGLKATGLTQYIPGAKDGFGRLHVNQELQVSDCNNVFVAGDAACAKADDQGHASFMTCQHALPQGRTAGYNAAADLLGLPMLQYSQPLYVCCIDLGSQGAIFTSGWDMQVKYSGAVAKQSKRYINQKVLYPPTDADEALRVSDPTIPSEGRGMPFGEGR